MQIVTAHFKYSLSKKKSKMSNYIYKSLKNY